MALIRNLKLGKNTIQLGCNKLLKLKVKKTHQNNTSIQHLPKQIDPLCHSNTELKSSSVSHVEQSKQHAAQYCSLESSVAVSRFGNQQAGGRGAPPLVLPNTANPTLMPISRPSQVKNNSCERNEHTKYCCTTK